jgi:hypothetical protein
MNTLKRFAGVLWIVAGPLAIYYLIKTAASEINKKPVIGHKNSMGSLCYCLYANSNRHYDIWLLRDKRRI